MTDRDDSALDAVHTFKNHLAIIVGFSDLLLADLPQDSPHRKDVQEINKAGHEALKLLASIFPKHGAAGGSKAADQA